MIELRRLRVQNAVFLSIAFVALLYALFPGRFDSDSWWMYTQSQDINAINDANSPLLAFFMSMTREFVAGPAILFTVQLTLWFVGLWLVSDTLIAAGCPLAGALSAIGCLTPLTAFIFLDVNKDTGMAAVGLVLLGLLTRTALLGAWRPTLYGFIGLAALALGFLGMRHNAFIALAPLVLAFVFLQWPSLQRTWGRGLAIGCSILLALVSADHVVKYQLIGAHRAWGVRQLVMFDVAGVTRFSGEDASSGLFGPDFQAQAARCYTPKWHDPFEWGDCRQDGATLAKLVQTGRGRRTLSQAWRRAVLGHPVSYLRHRLAYFNQLTRFSCADCATPMTTGAIWARPWEPQPSRITSSEVVIERLAMGLYNSNLARGCLWLAALTICATCSLLLLKRSQDRALPILTLGIAASGVAHALALLAIGMAAPSRYLHWTIMLGVLAIAMTSAAVSRHRRALARQETAEVVASAKVLARRTR
jgi:hypothetical protein